MMESLKNLSPKLKCINRESRCSSNIHTFSKPQTSFLILPLKNINVGISSLLHKNKHLVSPISCLLEKQTNVEDEGELSQGIDQSKMVRVKIQLKRECSFGQQFFIVGDDEMIGSWNPLEALRLNWSDGHVWTVDLNVPVGRTIKFKFLLKGDAEEDILWQPGLDRVLQVWETSNTICVSEDWDDAQLQKVTEAEVSCDKTDTSIAAVLEDKFTQPKERRAMNVKDLDSEKNEGISQPVLVPGLTIATIDDEQASNNEFVNTVEDNAFNVAESLKQVDNTYSRETTETMPVSEEANEESNNTKLNNENAVPLNSEVLENDIQWGRQTLQKFLSNLGIL